MVKYQSRMLEVEEKLVEVIKKVATLEVEKGKNFKLQYTRFIVRSHTLYFRSSQTASHILEKCWEKHKKGKIMSIYMKNVASDLCSC